MSLFLGALTLHGDTTINVSNGFVSPAFSEGVGQQDETVEFFLAQIPNWQSSAFLV